MHKMLNLLIIYKWYVCAWRSGELCYPPRPDSLNSFVDRLDHFTSNRRMLEPPLSEGLVNPPPRGFLTPSLLFLGFWKQEIQLRAPLTPLACPRRCLPMSARGRFSPAPCGQAPTNRFPSRGAQGFSEDGPRGSVAPGFFSSFGPQFLVFCFGPWFGPWPTEVVILPSPTDDSGRLRATQGNASARNH